MLYKGKDLDYFPFHERNMYANYFLQNGQNLDKLGCILEVLQDNCHRFP